MKINGQMILQSLITVLLSGLIMCAANMCERVHRLELSNARILAILGQGAINAKCGFLEPNLAVSGNQSNQSFQKGTKTAEIVAEIR